MFILYGSCMHPPKSLHCFSQLGSASARAAPTTIPNTSHLFQTVFVPCSASKTSFALYITKLGILPSTRATPSTSHEAYHSPWCSWFSTPDCNIPLSSEGPSFDPRRGDVSSLLAFWELHTWFRRLLAFLPSQRLLCLCLTNTPTALLWPECFARVANSCLIHQRFYVFPSSSTHRDFLSAFSKHNCVIIVVLTTPNVLDVDAEYPNSWLLCPAVFGKRKLRTYCRFLVF
jgi:hypothetical protein